MDFDGVINLVGNKLQEVLNYKDIGIRIYLETNSGLASIIIDMELYELGLDYLQRFPDLINAITIEDVQCAAQKYLSTDQIAIAVAGPDITR